MRFFLLLLTILFLGGASEVDAVSKYKVTPRVMDLDVDQRDLFTRTITVENLSPHKVSVFPAVNEVITDDGGDILDFETASMIGDKSSSPTTWVEMPRRVTEMMPGETIEIPVSFRIHQDAVAGNYQLFLGFGTGQNRQIAERQVMEGQAPGVVITLAVAQNKSEFLKLDRFVVDRFVSNVDNTAISYTLNNPGESTVLPKGEIIFYNGRGEEVGSVPVNENTESLAPNESKTYEIAAPVDGYLGKYKAFLSVDYGTVQVASVYDTTFFYVIPWQKLLLLFMIVLLVAVVLSVIVHRRYTAKAAGDDEHGAFHLPLHVFEGKSDDIDHDINLK